MSAVDSTLDKHELPVGYRVAEFEIRRVLGSGGFGITYLAWDCDLRREVVVKENLPFQCALRDSTRSVRPRSNSDADREQFDWALQSFLREAETLSRFDHPNIVRVLRRFEANNTAYFVMPYLPGSSLKQEIDEQVKRGEAFNEKTLRQLLNPLLDALETLHAAGVYHRDIKAANILLVSGHRPILIDFGAARNFISEKSHTIVESAGFTPFEQLQSHGKRRPLERPLRARRRLLHRGPRKNPAPRQRPDAERPDRLPRQKIWRRLFRVLPRGDRLVPARRRAGAAAKRRRAARGAPGPRRGPATAPGREKPRADQRSRQDGLAPGAENDAAETARPGPRAGPSRSASS